VALLFLALVATTLAAPTWTSQLKAVTTTQLSSLSNVPLTNADFESFTANGVTISPGASNFAQGKWVHFADAGNSGLQTPIVVTGWQCGGTCSGSSAGLYDTPSTEAKSGDENVLFFNSASAYVYQNISPTCSSGKTFKLSAAVGGGNGGSDGGYTIGIWDVASGAAVKSISAGVNGATDTSSNGQYVNTEMTLNCDDYSSYNGRQLQIRLAKSKGGQGHVHYVQLQESGGSGAQQMLGESTISSTDLDFSHHSAYSTVNSDFTLQVTVTPTDDAYPRSYCPFYFGVNPTSSGHTGLSIGHGQDKTYLQVRMADGSNLVSKNFQYGYSLSTHNMYRFDLKCTKESNQRKCRVYVNGVESSSGEQTFGVSNNIYASNGGKFGNVWGWRFIGTMHSASVAPGITAGSHFAGQETAILGTSTIDQTNVDFQHNNAYNVMNTGAWTLTAIVTPTNDAYPRSYCPFYFGVNPTASSHKGLSIGHGQDKTYLQVRMADGSNLHSFNFQYASSLSVNNQYRFELKCKKDSSGRKCRVYVNGVESTSGEQTFGVSNNIYDANGGRFGNVWGWRFIGTLTGVTFNEDGEATASPTNVPTTLSPTYPPTRSPTRTPTEHPTTRPPSPSPSHTPTEHPTRTPTPTPTVNPTTLPPTFGPTAIVYNCHCQGCKGHMKHNEHDEFLANPEICGEWCEHDCGTVKVVKVNPDCKGSSCQTRRAWSSGSCGCKFAMFDAGSKKCYVYNAATANNIRYEVKPLSSGISNQYTCYHKAGAGAQQVF